MGSTVGDINDRNRMDGVGRRLISSVLMDQFTSVYEALYQIYAIYALLILLNYKSYYYYPWMLDVQVHIG